MPRKRIIAAVITVLFTTSAIASVQDEMTSWFNEMGSYGNVTMPQAVQGQTSTTYTGGSMYMRSPVRSYQLASVTAPSMRAGCGGIDLFAGSFSFINSEQLTAMLRNIANNAVGYAFMMAVQAVSPDLADLLKYLQDQASKINNLTVNSCAAAENLVNMTGLAGQAKAQQAMTAMSSASWLNNFPDSYDTWKNTKNDPAATKQLTNQAVAADPTLKKYLKPGNVIWEAMVKTNAPDDMKEIMMSLVGTVIITSTGEKGNSEPTTTYRGPLLTFKQLIGTPQQSTSRIDLWRCVSKSEGDDGLPPCADIVDTTENIVPFAYRVRLMMEKGSTQIIARGDQNFTDQEKFFLSGSATPLWRLISSSANSAAGAVMISDEYSTVVAAEVTQSFVNETMRQLGRAISNAKGMQSPANLAALKEVMESYRQVSLQMAEEMRDIYAKAVAVAETQKKIQWIHETMMQGVSGDLRKSLTAFGGR
ncbi:MAG: conjugal transfer protein TraH [Pseudomonadota bacterium]|nr:conjugal transfer protein TraH [Pseudomonadota bacterium]MDP1904210.1 conjugal transfer protein TraH [Pseudomonadota bacterium]